MWKQGLLIFIGGGFGSLLRFGISKITAPMQNLFPWATFSANLLGCFLFGLVAGVLLQVDTLKSEGAFLLLVGFCGGLTTFSSFINESHQLLNAQSFLVLVLYNIGSLFLGMLALALGYWIAKSML
ncbi:MAG: fluoride efflux transporter CrcB [Bacteroidetes bacterium]|nr:fluoride efflux transporter CrcB [Bacteroidota bacterium]MDA0937544.1 fluoride efflux transporter CrcB [Bacteroidota bacterium]MDA1345057.1 fluoride efflux transporter CrcB [Bacteroidota bacterium]